MPLRANTYSPTSPPERRALRVVASPAWAITPATSAPPMLETPPEVGQRQGDERADDQERGGGQGRGRLRHEHAGQPGEERRDRERPELGPSDVDARRRGGPFVGPHGQPAQPGPVAPQVRDADARRCQHHQHHEAERRPEVVRAAGADADVEPEEVGPGGGAPAAPPENAGLARTSCSMATANASVVIARLMPRTRVAGRPTRTPSTVDNSAADDRGHQERHTVVGQVDHRETRHPGEGQLRQRDLPDVAGDDHDRQRKEREDHRDDDRLSVAGSEGEQPHQ